MPVDLHGDGTLEKLYVHHHAKAVLLTDKRAAQPAQATLRYPDALANA